MVTVTLSSRSPELPTSEAACANVYCVVRGFEVPATESLVLPSGYSVPVTARMTLQKSNVVVQPNAWVPLFNLSSGFEALILGLTVGLQTSPPWGTQINGRLSVRNNYVEGCWSLLRNATETLPGQVGNMNMFDSIKNEIFVYQYVGSRYRTRRFL